MANNNGASKATTWFIIGFIVVVTAGVIIAGAYSSGTSSSNATSTDPGFVATTVPPITSADQAESEGNPNAKVSLIEYGDYECPACGQYAPLVKQLIAAYSNQVEFVFRNFPLYSIHPDASIGAQAAEAAALQGKFWQMHDMLYANQSQWSTVDPTKVVAEYLNGYASSIGLNVTQFDADLGSSQVLNKIQTDVNGGTAAQIDHTPTFFVNLTQIPNPTSYSDFQNVLNAALAAASSTSSTSSVPVTNINVGTSGVITVTSTSL
jgi:protein-disulfide isomerase